NGDVEPRGVIAGPKTGIIKIRQVVVDEERGQIFATIKNNFENYDVAQARPTPWNPDRTGFIGVWSITDNGDVPPRGVIKGPASGLIWPAGVAINPANHEVYAIDSVSNALFMFHMPELFQAPRMTTAQSVNRCSVRVGQAPVSVARVCRVHCCRCCRCCFLLRPSPARNPPRPATTSCPRRAR